MGEGFALPISYDQLMLLVMGLFMFVGATRGWFQEFVSSCVLLLLTASLVKPGFAEQLVGYISKVVRLVVAFVQGLGNLDFGALEERYKATSLPFDGENPYMLLIGVLILFVFVSYSLRFAATGLTPLSRILGGLLGLFNGFMVISLFKEYVLRYFQKASPGMWAQAGSSPEVSVTLRNVPAGDFLGGERWRIALVLLALMVGILFFSMVTGRPIGKK